MQTAGVVVESNANLGVNMHSSVSEMQTAGVVVEY